MIHGRLSEDSKAYLNKLPKEQKLKVEDVNIYMAHYPISKFGIYKQFIKTPTLEESEKLFEDVDADVYIYGHTHIFSENKSNDKLYLNLDSTGCPVKTNYASAGILNINGKNAEYQVLAVNYDVEKVKYEIKELKYSFYQKVLEIFY